MRADRKKPKVVPARKPIAKATNDIGMELVNQVRGFLAPVGQLFVPMRQPAVAAMKTRYRGTCRRGNMLFDDQLVGARAAASFFPFS
jgi:hypothetical protein